MSTIHLKYDAIDTRAIAIHNLKMAIESMNVNTTTKT